MSALATLALCFVAATQAAPPANAPAPKPQPLQALIISVDGKAEWKAAGATTWKAAAVDDVLDAGCEIRTGLRTTMALRVGKNATLLVDRSSRVELPLIVQDGTVLRTRAAVWRGRCDIKVEAAGVTSDFQVLTPSATLAVRGTGFSVMWGAFAGLEVKGVDTNRIDAIEVHYLVTHQKVLLSGGGSSSEERPDPVDEALWHTVYPPPWPDRAVDDVDDPARYPPQVIHDLEQQVEIQKGGSDLGVDLSSGRGTPGKGQSRKRTGGP